MKIYSNKPEGQGVNRPAQATERTEIKGKQVSGPAKALTDKIDISSKSKEVADLMATIDQMPEVRDKKIKETQDALNAGAYSADPKKIVDKMLNEL
jgi:flagellar biosynthesis anti-sigma factor FlgM